MRIAPHDEHNKSVAYHPFEWLIFLLYRTRNGIATSFAKQTQKRQSAYEKQKRDC